MNWYRKAAEQDNAKAQNSLGYCYHIGKGVEKSAVWAVYWYRKAVKQNLPEAQFNLGLCYENGDGVSQDHATALTNFWKSRDQGFKSDTSEPVFSDWITAGEPQKVQADPSQAVDMTREEGVLKVTVQINDTISLKFVLDSGASDVQIPKDVFLTLMRADTIGENDFLPGETFVLADGSKVKSRRFNIRSIKVGNSTFTDVPASIGGLDSTLLLGQSFLSRFDEWRIDNKKSQLILMLK